MILAAQTSMSGAVPRHEVANQGRQVMTNASPESSRGRFDQMLARVLGQPAESDIADTSLLPAQLLALAHPLALAGESSEASLEPLLEWLASAAELIGQSSDEIAEMLEACPQLLPILASIMELAVVQENSFGSLGSGIAEPRAERIPEQLLQVIEQMRSGLQEGRATEEAAGRVKAFQEMLEPLLNPLRQAQEQSKASLEAGRTAHETGRNLVIHDALISQLQEKVSQVQKLYSTNAEQLTMTRETVNLPVSAQIDHRPVLPGSTLIRPEFIHLAYANVTEEAVLTETIVNDPTQTPFIWEGEGLKTAGEASLVRPAATSVPQVPVHEFAQFLDRFIVRSLQIHQTNGFSEAKISLVPEHLGHVEIKLTLQNGQLTAQLVAETVLGREMLEQHIGSLRQSLQTQGLQVERLEVLQQSSSTQTFLKDQGHSQQSYQHKHREPKAEKIEFEDIAVEFDEEPELVGTHYETYMNSRSFHATA